MHCETRSYNQLVQSGAIVSYPEPEGIPAKYENWVKGRGAHLASAIITRTGDLLNNPENSVLRNSIDVARDFHSVLGVEYKVIDEDKLSDNTGNELKQKENPAVFLYKNSQNILDKFNLVNSKDLQFIGNPVELSKYGKEVLHYGSKEINSEEDLLNSGQVNGFDVAIGATCDSKEELRRISDMCRKAGKEFICKDPYGTDGNGITTDLSKVEKFPVIIEEKLDFKYTISVQYMNGVLGVLRENEKFEGDKRWRGNTFPYIDPEIGNGEVKKLENKAIEDAKHFRKYLHKLTGIDPTIFGLDFAVCEKDGELKSYLIDPNMRMPGNMYLYYQMRLLESKGYKTKFVDTSLLYEQEVPKFDGYDLQRRLDDMGIGLIKYNEFGEATGFNLDVNGNLDGVIIIVQDPGRDGADNLSMINIFGKDKKRTDQIKEMFIQI